MFLPFMDLYGNPVLIRPERVTALRGIAVMWGGKPVRGTLVVLDNREVFRIQGDAEAVAERIETWLAEFAKPTRLDLSAPGSFGTPRDGYRHSDGGSL